jgi:hypothetical protein
VTCVLHSRSFNFDFVPDLKKKLLLYSVLTKSVLQNRQAGG